MFEIAAALVLLLPQQSSTSEAPKATPEPAAQERRTELNLLGSTDSEAGESRRNENVQFNLIDNNALKYLNLRLGTNAAIVVEFRPERKYFGTEFGNAPAGVVHLSPIRQNDRFHGAMSVARSDSIFNARSFFQAGSVLPAHENNYGFIV